MNKNLTSLRTRYNYYYKQSQTGFCCDQSYHTGIAGNIISMSYNSGIDRYEPRRKLWFHQIFLRWQKSLDTSFHPRKNLSGIIFYRNIKEFTPKGIMKKIINESHSVCWQQKEVL